MPAVNARTAIGGVIGTNWVSGGAVRTPIAWPNVQFTPPAKKPWIRVSITDGDATQVTIGSDTNMHRHIGVLFIQVFTPANTGDLVAKGMADDLAAIFRGLDVDGATNEVLRFRTPRVREIGVDGAYYQVNCEVPFARDLIV